VLVTRPAGQGDELCAALEGAGFSVHSLPLLQLLPLAELDPVQRQRVLDLDHFSHIIFVSGNAVRLGMAWIEACWPQLPLGLHWYAVGEATAGELSAHGVSVLSPATEMTSEGLLALPQLQAVAGQRVLIVKGEGGRATLADSLGRRGARVEELACYRRIPPDLASGELAQKLSQWAIGVVLISSGEGLANLLALLSPAETTKFADITLLVPSPRVAQMARAAGFSRVITAENASDSAMLRALAGLQTATGE
nr:uroporphyrinogen-III synthase [Halioglobus sp.]